MERTRAQRAKLQAQDGFIAALDQSGGSTPKALALYGIPEGAWSNDTEMFELVHRMRARIMASRAFGGDRILAAILFEDTMDREVGGRPTADYLWEEKQVVPLLKVDQGLAPEADGVRLMRPIVGLGGLLQRALERRVFGTKMRSVIAQANPGGISAIVAQQFEVAAQILDAGLVPIIEPEVDIHCPDKGEAERRLEQALRDAVGRLPPGREVMLKLTLPSVDDLYRDLIAHPRVLRVVALSGGYSRAEANQRLCRQRGMVASFSRALTEGLSAQQSDAEFDAALDAAIQAIFEASRAGGVTSTR